MSRPLRIDYPNAWHHVMNRAQRGQDLFIDKVDYQQFIGLLQESTDLEGALRTIFIDEKTVGADDG